MDTVAEKQKTTPTLPPECKPVNVGSKLRKAYAWFEELTDKVKKGALEKRKTKERKNGNKLSEKDLLATVDRMDEIQRQINPLATELDGLKEKVLAHWGHTGVEEIEGTSGKTLITPSFELCVQPDIVKQGISPSRWYAITERVLQPDRLLAEGKDDDELREVANDALKVGKLRVSVTPPSSRRPKSGEAEEE